MYNSVSTYCATREPRLLREEDNSSERNDYGKVKRREKAETVDMINDVRLAGR